MKWATERHSVPKMQQRREEILQKKAKLAELKRQRELRQSQGGNRASFSGSDVRPSPSAYCFVMANANQDAS